VVYTIENNCMLCSTMLMQKEIYFTLSAKDSFIPLASSWLHQDVIEPCNSIDLNSLIIITQWTPHKHQVVIAIQPMCFS